MTERPERDIEELIAARGGDDRAGRSLVSRHGPSMLRTAWRTLGRYGGHEADDVVQEAFIAALTTQALPTGNVGAWLRAITVRKALDWRRDRLRRGHSLPVPDEGGCASSDGPASRATLDVLIVRQALGRLRPLDRAVLILVDLEGRSMAEAAEVLGSSRVALKWRAVRARRQLARLLREPEEEEEEEEKGGGRS